MEEVPMYSNYFVPCSFGIGDDDEADLFGMYGTPDDKAKIVRVSLIILPNPPHFVRISPFVCFCLL
jgi:hypothetical protein